MREDLGMEVRALPDAVGGVGWVAFTPLLLCRRVVKTTSRRVGDNIFMFVSFVT